MTLTGTSQKKNCGWLLNSWKATKTPHLVAQEMQKRRVSGILFIRLAKWRSIDIIQCW